MGRPGPARGGFVPAGASGPEGWSLFPRPHRAVTGRAANGPALRLSLAAVEAALKLHKPHVRRQNWPPVCSYDNRRWPCPEIAAIAAALTGTETPGDH